MIQHSKEPFMVVTSSNKFVGSDVLKTYAIKSNGESNQIRDDPFTNSYGEMGLINPLYDPNYLMNLADANTYHAISLDTQALDVANMGWSLKPVGDNPSQQNYDKLMLFFNKVFEDNPFLKAQRDKAELGYATIEVVRAADNLKADIINLSHVPAYTVRIHKDRNKYCQARGSAKVWFKRFAYEQDVDLKTGSESELGLMDVPETIGTPASELLWNTNYTPRSDYYGVPKIIPAIRAMYASLSALDYNIAFFENYGIPAYAVFISGNYSDSLVDDDDPTKGTKLQAAVREKFAAAQSNPHSTMVFSVPSEDEEGKVEIRFERLSVETKEASFRLLRTDNRDEIITAHRMDPYRIGININGPLGGNAAEISRENYKSSVQIPEQQSWENIINMVIRHEYGFQIEDWRFEFNHFDLDDKSSEMTRVQNAFNVAAMSPNDIIRVMGDEWDLEPIDHPAMDAHYLNGRPLDYDVPVPMNEEVLDTLKTLKENLLEVATVDDSRSNQSIGPGDNRTRVLPEA